MTLTVEDSCGKAHSLLIIFYSPSVFRLRFDPFSTEPYTDSSGSGFSYAVVDDRKDAQGKPEHSYAIVKEKPDRLDIKVRVGWHLPLCMHCAIQAACSGFFCTDIL